MIYVDIYVPRVTPPAHFRIRAEGAFRVFYVTKRAEGIVVLHAFQKKTQQTAQLDVDLAARRYRPYLAAQRPR